MWDPRHCNRKFAITIKDVWFKDVLFKDVLRQPVVCGEGEEAVGEDPVVCQPDPRDLRSWG